jgi:hypothetical protein
MARRRHREGAGISLLPILSIQKCTMGVLVVIICAQNVVSLGKTADQYLELAGPEKGREPVYVECQAKGVLIHPQKKEVSLETLKGPGPSAFHELLDRLKADALQAGAGKSKQYLVLLIRPEGIATYERCVRIVGEVRLPNGSQLDIGKDALLSGGNVVLTKEGRPLLNTKAVR